LEGFDADATPVPGIESRASVVPGEKKLAVCQGPRLHSPGERILPLPSGRWEAPIQFVGKPGGLELVPEGSAAPLADPKNVVVHSHLVLREGEDTTEYQPGVCRAFRWEERYRLKGDEPKNTVEDPGKRTVGRGICRHNDNQVSPIGDSSIATQKTTERTVG
jgi:hypothetical protein